jgi:hypothetical protein
MFRLCGLLLLLIVASFAAPAPAMEFHLLTMGNGQVAAVATGVIKDGDVRRLTVALNRATRGRDGTKLLLLSSPGGNVGQAAQMTMVMDQVGVSTIVPAGAMCGSACASILFVSGKYRTIEKGGILAIHSCSDGRTGRQMEFCNLLISAHAQHEGASGIAMMALQQTAGTHNLFVLGPDAAACFGFTRRVGGPAKAAAPCIKTAMKQARRR